MRRFRSFCVATVLVFAVFAFFESRPNQIIRISTSIVSHSAPQRSDTATNLVRVKQIPFFYRDYGQPRSVEGLGWVDRNGKNTMMFSVSERGVFDSALGRMSRRDLTVVHLLTDDVETTVFHEFKDQGTCGLDERVEFRFVPTVNGVTDLDDDGIGEATFGYQKSCGDDEQGVTRLFLSENRIDYGLRGSNKRGVDSGDRRVFSADPLIKDNERFLAHATEVWKTMFTDP